MGLVVTLVDSKWQDVHLLGQEVQPRQVLLLLVDLLLLQLLHHLHPQVAQYSQEGLTLFPNRTDFLNNMAFLADNTTFLAYNMDYPDNMAFLDNMASPDKSAFLDRSTFLVNNPSTGSVLSQRER